jgi:hypothetical protein
LQGVFSGGPHATARVHHAIGDWVAQADTGIPANAIAKASAQDQIVISKVSLDCYLAK